MTTVVVAELRSGRLVRSLYSERGSNAAPAGRCGVAPRKSLPGGAGEKRTDDANF